MVNNKNCWFAAIIQVTLWNTGIYYITVGNHQYVYSKNWLQAYTDPILTDHIQYVLGHQAIHQYIYDFDIEVILTYHIQLNLFITRSFFV